MKTLPRIIVLLGCLLLTSALGSAQTPKGAAQSVRERSQSATQALDAGAVRSATSLAAPPSALKMFRGGPLRFEKNAGQFDPQVRFASRGLAHTLFLTPREAVLVLTRQEAPPPRGPKWRERIHTRSAAATQTVARFKLAGANLSSEIEGEDQLPGRSNYLIGRDRSAWHTDVPNFSRVRYRDVYPGVDWVYYGNEGQIEHDFVVSPGADPSRIVLEVAIDGSKSDEPVRVSPEGDLILASQPEGIRFHRPVAYQMSAGQRQLVSANYTIKAPGRFGFELGPYDPSRPIIIDPVLNFSTYLGGTNGDSFGFGVAVDSTGIYVVGRTNAGNFPTTAGVRQPDPGAGSVNCFSVASPNPCFDAFVSKLSPGGTSLVYSTFLGGNTLDEAFAIAVNGSGEAYVVGETISPDFPVTVSAFQPGINPGSCGTYTCEDAFVAVLKSDGSDLIYSSYLGGSDTDFGNTIAVDSLNNFFVTGNTYSADFPATIGSFTVGDTCGTSPNTFTCGEAFVGKFNPAASGNASRVYLRYLGGHGDDYGSSVAVQNSTGNAIVAGVTTATSTGTNTFPIVGGFQTTFGGGFSDGFIAKINSDGSSVLYSSYLGGNDEDQAVGIALDSTGKALVTGYTISSNFQVKNAVQPTLDTSSTSCGTSACFDAFLTKVDTALTGASSLIFSTYLGGSDDDRAVAIAVDGSDNPVISGATATPQTGVTKPFPLQTPLQSTKGGALGEYDAFITKLTSTGSSITFSTYFGGGGNFDLATSIAVGPANEIVIAGRTNSATFPITLDAFEPSSQGPNDDAFVAKIDTANLPAAAFSSDELFFGPVGVGFTSVKTLTLQNMGTAALSISDIAITGTNAAKFTFGDNCGSSVASGSKCLIDVTFAPTTTGVHSATLTVTDNASGSPHQIALSGTGIAAPAVSLTPPATLTFPDTLVGTTSSAMTITVTNSGTFNLNITNVSKVGAAYAVSGCSAVVVAPGNNCVISVTFSPTTTGTITGSVSITDDAPGSPQTIALTGTGFQPEFTVTPGTTSATVNAGATASYTLTITPVNGFNQQVTFSCSGAPVRSTCNPPAATTLDGTNSKDVTVSVVTQARSAAPPGVGPFTVPPLTAPQRYLPWLALWMLLATASMALAGKRRRTWLLLATTLLLVLFWTACGGGGGGVTPAPKGTPAGTYTITVRATSGSITKTTTLSLKVN